MVRPNFGKRRYSSLATVGTLACLSACYGPSQDFPIGSELWLKSNPEFQASENPRFQAAKKVTVAVLDGGVDYNHPSLRGNITPFATSEEMTGRTYGIGYDLLGGPTDFFPHYSVYASQDGDDYSDALQIKEHGTHVAGLAALRHPEVTVLPVRVLPIPEKKDENLTADAMLFGGEGVKARFSLDAIEHVANGMKLACNHGARILNLSLGIDFSSLSPQAQQNIASSLDSSILSTIRTDCGRSLLVVAAGNESREVNDVAFSIPVTLEETNIIGVGALKSRADSVAAYYSNQGRFVDVFIRGSDVRSAVPGTLENADLRASLTGTSMATPLISHLAARILLITPELSPQELRSLILNTAELRELKLEKTPDEAKSEDAATPALPEKRLGLVASYANALRAAKELAAASSDARGDLEKRYLRAPFEHGHSPF